MRNALSTETALSHFTKPFLYDTFDEHPLNRCTNVSELTDRRRDTLRLIVEKRGGVSKVSKMLGYTNLDSVDHGGAPRESHVRQLARLLKQKGPGTLRRPGQPT